MLGGTWDAVERTFVVERQFGGAMRYGRLKVEEAAARVHASARHGSLLAGGAPVTPPIVFFDLETTGLNGGAGTFAFLVGCGRFGADGSFATRQFLLVSPGEERSMLEAIARELADAGSLVSFNGKSFDGPLLETRYLFHRLECVVRKLPHLDVLHAARRFWAARQTEVSCSLTMLERYVLETSREGDVPGFEIPSRYFQFVRCADPRPLTAILEHNRLDLLALACLTARLLELVDSGVDAVRTPDEALALARTYSAARIEARAREAFYWALDMTRRSDVRISALRGLALLERRARRHEGAARCWHELLAMSACPANVLAEAAEALAIHHEHRVRDLETAKSFALKSLERPLPPRRSDAVRHRLARIERKMRMYSLW